jgi:hypothetical protein
MATQAECANILLARNRTKRRCNDFMYEAMRTMMRTPNHTASEFAFACSAMALKAMGKDLSFLNEDDLLIIKKIRVCITRKK